MKIGIIQCDVKAGDFAFNAEIIAEVVRGIGNVDLCLAPAFALSGPLADCILENPAFREAYAAHEAELARKLENCPPLLFATDRQWRFLRNGMAMSLGNELYLAGKRLVPIRLGGAFTNTQDMEAADILLCPAAIAFDGSLPDYARFAELAAKNAAWLVVANLVGGYDNVIYPGASAVFDAHGRLQLVGPVFESWHGLVDDDVDDPLLALPQWNPDNLVLRALILGTADFVRKCGGSSVVLGISGGMDSALVAAIAAEALGAENVLGIMMPSPFSSKGSVDDSKELAKNLGIGTMELPIGELMDCFGKSLEPLFGRFARRAGDTTDQNIQARIRGNILAAASNRSGSLILNTGNKSETAMGYFTLYGDSAGALAVIGDVYKTGVYRLAALVNERAGREIIPQNIFTKPPSAELAPNQKDVDSLPPYEELDPALEELLSSNGPNMPAKLWEVGKIFFAQEFKRRQCPPALIVSKTPLAACKRPIAGKLDLAGSGHDG